MMKTPKTTTSVTSLPVIPFISDLKDQLESLTSNRLEFGQQSFLLLDMLKSVLKKGKASELSAAASTQSNQTSSSAGIFSSTNSEIIYLTIFNMLSKSR